MRTNTTRQEPTNTTRQLGQSTYQATDKLTTVSNFNSVGHRNGGNQNRTVSPNMRPSHLFTEQPVTSPLFKKDQKLQKRNTKMTKVIGTSRPMQGTKERGKLTQDTNTIRPGSKISTRNGTTMRARKRGRSTLTRIASLRAFLRPP